MRKTIRAAVAGLAIAGGAAAIAGTAQAQYYPPTSGYYNGYNNGYYNNGYAGQPVYDPYTRTWRYPSAPYTAPYSGYSAPYTTAPYSTYGYNNYNYGTRNSGLSAGLAILGSLFGLNTGSLAYNGYGYQTPYGNVPVDQYGPDPNGMIAPDGHRIKCKLRSTYDSYYRQSVVRRECR